MDIKIPYKKNKDADSAFETIKKRLTVEYFEQFNVKGKIKADTKKKVITASGTGFTFSLTFKEKEAHGELELSLLLRPFKSKIIPVVEKNLKEVL